MQLEGRYSRGTQQLVALAGSLEPFRIGEQVLREMANLDVSHESCRQFTEQLGDWLDEQPLVFPEAPAAWDFSIPATATQRWTNTVAYVGMDAFAVPVLNDTRQRAFRMLYVGLLYDARKEHTIYLTNFDHETLAEQLRAAAIQCGFGRASQVVALTDAGQGLERVLTQHFGGNVIPIVDFWHAAERLHQFANVWHGVGSAAAQDWVHAAKGVLRFQGGAALRRWLDGHAPPSDATTALQTAWSELVTYFTNQHHRMDYPTYEAHGWDIGSGPTEAGCKSLSGRLKRTGMKWLTANVAAVARVRALYLSGEGLWQKLWSREFHLAA